MKKLRKDAKCPVCKHLLSETPQDLKKVHCQCGWERPEPDLRFYDKISNAGRPRLSNRLGLTPYDIAAEDDDAPAWFFEAMMLQEKWITVQEFAAAFGTQATQVRRWCDAGLIHCVWTDHTYKKGNVKWRHYRFHRPEKGGHRRIPPGEVERCHFLKLKQHRKVVRTIEKPPNWRIDEPEIDLSVFEEK